MVLIAVVAVLLVALAVGLRTHRARHRWVSPYAVFRDAGARVTRTSGSAFRVAGAQIARSAPSQ